MAPSPTHEPHEEQNGLGSRMATVAAVGVGIALIEEELIPGLLIGATAALAPGLLPRLGRILRPVIKTMVRVGYRVVETARETVAEANESLQDLVAEVRAEQEVGSTGELKPQST